nr:sensor histidine kinase [Butyrivibrio sp.]
ILVIDALILHTLFNAGREARNAQYLDAARTVEYTLTDMFDDADDIVKSVYIKKKIYDFLDKEYTSGYEYYDAFTSMKNQYLIWGQASLLNSYITFYTDNETVLNGNGIQKLSKIKDKDWYKSFVSSGKDELLYFDFFADDIKSIKPKRHIYLIKKFNFYPRFDIEKLVVVEMDYDNAILELNNVDRSVSVEVVADGKVILSNNSNELSVYNFTEPVEASRVAYTKNINFYGYDMQIRVLKTKNYILAAVMENSYIYLILIAVSFILPFLAIRVFQRYFTRRLLTLTDAVQNADQDHLVKIDNVEGVDEIAFLGRNYNDMADRINNLIESVYKHQIRENEEMVARQRAELLALRSQINPHFLFNALESIRMHSLIKQEKETARMIENLAIIQRQYVEWNNDEVKIEEEMNFVKAYLNLQKYRFGERLSFSLSVDDDCKNIWIPKLSIVTFVENACVHGIEEKATNGWIFVRIYSEEKDIVIEIEDTGIGMDREGVEEIRQRMDNASIETLHDKSRIGITNACVRLKMFSDNKVRFDISSEEAVGTMVTVRFPKQEL